LRGSFSQKNAFAGETTNFAGEGTPVISPCLLVDRQEARLATANGRCQVSQHENAEKTTNREVEMAIMRLCLAAAIIGVLGIAAPSRASADWFQFGPVEAADVVGLNTLLEPTRI